MPSISVRKLDEKTVAALRSRAARHGVSMEEEVRRILERAVETEESAGAMMVRIFSRSWDGVPFEPPPREEYAEPMSFDEEE
ncbi:MAG: hypothetical protein MRY64_15045 [Hyphomonadaceae bacterium]|nr:hypothetical protein [Hyphomonadaceae bacterium]